MIMMMTMMMNTPESVSTAQASSGRPTGQCHTVLCSVPLKELLQITMLHILCDDTRTWITAMMTSDHHTEQTDNIGVIQTSQHCYFSLKVEPTTDSNHILRKSTEDDNTENLNNKTKHKQTQLEKVALDGSVKCCAPPPRWCDLEL